MASGSSRAYKLQLSVEGVALFLRCHDRLCRAVGDLLPYGSTLFVAVKLFQQRSSEDAASAFLEPGLERMGGKMIRYVGTSSALSTMLEELGQKILETELVFSRPQIWKLFLAALSSMQDVEDSEILSCYHSAGFRNRAE